MKGTSLHFSSSTTPLLFYFSPNHKYIKPSSNGIVCRLPSSPPIPASSFIQTPKPYSSIGPYCPSHQHSPPSKTKSNHAGSSIHLFRSRSRRYPEGRSTRWNRPGLRRLSDIEDGQSNCRQGTFTFYDFMTRARLLVVKLRFAASCPHIQRVV